MHFRNNLIVNASLNGNSIFHPLSRSLQPSVTRRRRRRKNRDRRNTLALGEKFSSDQNTGTEIGKTKNRREQLTIKQLHNINASNILLVKLTIAQISNNPVFVWCLRMPSGFNMFRSAITLLIRQSCSTTYFPRSLLLSLVHEYILIWWFSHIRSIMELVIQD